MKKVVDRLNQMEQQINLLKTGSSGNAAFSDVYLYQNAPNPFRERSLIRFSIPENFNSATMSIYASDGKMIKSYIIAKGTSQIEIAGGTFPAGIYNYTLFVNGKAVASKQMVLIQ